MSKPGIVRGSYKRGWGVATLSLFCIGLLAWFVSPAQAGPLSERVVFVAPRDTMPKIYICRSDGRDLQLLTKVPGSQIQPSYSEANQRFYFVQFEDRRERIVSVDSEGDDLQIHVESPSRAYYPDPSPDGKKLIFSTDRWGASELAEVDLASGKVTRMTYDQATNTYPRYSPDGAQVVYLSRRHGQSELYLRTLATGEVERLTQTPFEEGPASWSPDGKRLIATQLKPPRQRSYLLEIDLPSGQHRTLLPDTPRVQNPVYSKDGALVVFLHDQVLWTYDPADTKPQQFTLRGEFAPEFVKWIEFPLP